MNVTDAVVGIALTLAIGVPLIIGAVLVRQLIAISRRSHHQDPGTSTGTEDLE